MLGTAHHRCQMSELSEHPRSNEFPRNFLYFWFLTFSFIVMCLIMDELSNHSSSGTSQGTTRRVHSWRAYFFEGQTSTGREIMTMLTPSFQYINYFRGRLYFGIMLIIDRYSFQTHKTHYNRHWTSVRQNKTSDLRSLANVHRHQRTPKFPRSVGFPWCEATTWT